MKMLSDAISSSTNSTFCCQPTSEATASPVSRAAPTTLVTLPAAVDDRSALKRFGMAAGSCATALTDPVTVSANPLPTSLTASNRLCRWNVYDAAMPR